MMSRFSKIVAMRRVTLAAAACALVLASVADAGAAEDDLQTIQLLFVQSTPGGSFDGERLQLEHVGPTLFFTDRPFRVEGHIPTVEFARNWDQGDDSFSDDPPNAVLSILSEGKTHNATVELQNPMIDGTRMSYAVKVLDGSVPENFGTASLFIDHHNAGGYIAAGLGGLIGGYGLAKHADKEKERAEAAAPPAYYPPQYPQGAYYRAAPPAACP